MKKQRLFWFVFSAALFSVTAVRCSAPGASSGHYAETEPVPLENQRFLERQNGITFPLWKSDTYSEFDVNLSLEKLASIGFNWIAFVVTGYQDTVASTTITPPDVTLDANLIRFIAKAHNLGLKVMLKPHVNIRDDLIHWRGQIGKKFTTEGEWSAWFDSYRNFIEHYAGLAREYGVAEFSVGTELSATTHRSSDWREVIKGVRARYDGLITYAADHRGEATVITWWDAVDKIGIDAYYSLTNKNDPTLEELRAAWKPHLAALAGLASRWGKPILFTEIGYRSMNGANRRPWDWRRKGIVDLQEQADAYQTVFLTVYNQPWFAGMFWWTWGHDPFEGGSGDDGYTPHHKPAEKILRLWLNF